jgi:hypothetical protein
MNQPTGGRPQQPHPGRQPGPQQYPGQQPGPQQYPGQPGQPPGQPPYPGQPPFPGQPYPGQQHYPGQPPFPGAQPPYPGQPYPGPPRPQGKGAAIIAGLLYLPGVLLALTGSVSLATHGEFGRDLWGAILMPPIPGAVIGFDPDLVIALSFVLPGLALVLAVLLLARVPGVRWGLVLISLLAAVHYGLRLAKFMSTLPPTFGIMPVIALLLWLVPGLVAILPPVGRAMRGAKPKMPPHQVAGPPPPPPGPPPQGQWG